MGGKNSYESIKRYEDKAYDKVLVRLPKGTKENIQAHAEAHSESVNGFINQAITETMERDNGAPARSEERNRCKNGLLPEGAGVPVPKGTGEQWPYRRGHRDQNRSGR